MNVKLRATVILVGLIVAIFVMYGGNSQNIESVQIGVVAPLSGIRADAGEFTRNGIALAAAEIAVDPSRDIALEFIYEDTQYAPEVAVSSVRKLIDLDDIRYIIGPYGSSQALAVAPIVEEAQRILITPGSQSDEVSHAGDYIFRNIHNAQQEAPVFGEFVASHMQSDTLHFLAINTAFTDAYLNNLLPTLESYGKQIGLIERLEVSETDFRTQLLKIKEESPTDIFMIATPKHAGLILEQRMGLGIEAQYYNIGVEGPDTVAVAGEAAEGLLYPYSYDSQSDEPRVQAFYSNYTTEFGSEPDTIAANAYDAVYLLSNCLEQIGDDVEQVKACLYATDNFSGASGTYGFDENGDADKDIFIKTIRGGEFVRYED